jgi:hypothetical protein
MTLLPDLLSLEIDHFIRQTIEAALDAAGGDPDLAAGLKQSPHRFHEEVKRLGLLPSGERSERAIAVPQPEPVFKTHQEQKAFEGAGYVEAKLAPLAPSSPAPKPSRKGKPGRPPGRRRSPLASEPSATRPGPLQPPRGSSVDAGEDEDAEIVDY